MALSDRDVEELRTKLSQVGLPLSFNGDRLAAMQLGVAVTLQLLQGSVTLDRQQVANVGVESK